ACHERDANKRQAFLVEMERLEPHNCVYLDEAGIDNTEDYSYGWCKRGDRWSTSTYECGSRN
ncbi:MAG: hypothetical protein ACFBSG_05600, partial [Leptolyngbyaceae cyanobacterium]